MYPQSLHIINVANPLLFKNNIVCFFSLILFAIFSCKFWLIIVLLPCASSFLKSTISTSGREELFALFVSSNSSISPSNAFLYVSMSGVALPKTTGKLYCFARYDAISLALYLGLVSDL